MSKIHGKQTRTLSTIRVSRAFSNLTVYFTDCLVWITNSARQHRSRQFELLASSLLFLDLSCPTRSDFVVPVSCLLFLIPFVPYGIILSAVFNPFQCNLVQVHKMLWKGSMHVFASGLKSVFVRWLHFSASVHSIWKRVLISSLLLWVRQPNSEYFIGWVRCNLSKFHCFHTVSSALFLWI